MSNFRNPSNSYNGVQVFIEELRVPTNNLTAAAPGKVYVVGQSLAFVDVNGTEHILADGAVTHQGDVTGPHSATVVAKWQGVPLQLSSPSDKQIPTYDATAGAWVLGTYSTPNFNASFLSSQWVDQGNGTATLSLNHNLTFSGDLKPHVNVYDTSTGKNMLVGSVDVEVTSTQVNLTCASNALFSGSIHLLLPFV
jgi:hypothetical protein